MEFGIKIDTAKMMRNLLLKSIDDIIKIYQDDVYWVAIKNTPQKRRLVISNMMKMRHWACNTSDECLVELLYNPGMLNTLEKFPDIMFRIINSENKQWMWKPRYILSLLILINYVVKYNWCESHHIGVISRGILRHEPNIRVGEYLKNISNSKTYQDNVRNIFNKIVVI